MCEIGGTVGDIEGLPFIEAIRQLRNELGREQTALIHVTLVPYISAAGELKTKPTQHSVRELTSLGVQPDVLLCRCEHPLPDSERAKIALFCNVRPAGSDPGARSPSRSMRCRCNITPKGSTQRCCGISGWKRPAPDLARWDDIIDRYPESRRAR